MRILRAFLALIALALPTAAQPAIFCAPVGEILDVMAEAGKNVGGARLDILEGSEASAFVVAAKSAIPIPDTRVVVVALVPDKAPLNVVVYYISLESCVVGGSGLAFEAWNGFRVDAGLQTVKRFIPGVDA